MITEETVFILGAGASRPYGYPTGKELRYKICNNLIEDLISDSLIQKKTSFYDNIVEFTRTFAKSNNKSIDLFLTRNPNFEFFGKFSITYYILKSEEQSNNPEELKNDEFDWYSELYDRLTKELLKSNDYEYLERTFSFIIFNYDRALENYLFESFKNSFTDINPTKIADELKKIPINHVYGQVVTLPWQGFNQFLSYRDENWKYNVSNFSKNIKVIYNQRNTPCLHDIMISIKAAKRIFFLGFGYANENMEVLNIVDNINANQKIYGTAYGFTKKEILKIKSYFSKTHKIDNPDLVIEDCDCLTLLRNYL
ncbi:MAG: hypothetical protein H8E11_07005 [Candidatus Cloacimonetes bacterium]|nr:hypothetical protein [Candidatus Cloacimonadota bacterium]